jgi:hypothetical protein
MKKYLYALVVVCGLVASSLALADQPMAMTPEKMAAIKHANPMPNLMMVVVKHEKELGLDDEQKAALAAWRKEAQPRMMEMVKTVIKLEKQIHDAALAGASGAVLQQLAAKLFNVRGAIIKQKLACRNNMAKILGMEKMKKVIELYKAGMGGKPAEA